MRFALAALLAAAACGPAPAPPVKVMILAPSADGTFEPREAELATIGNLTTFKGAVASFIGGARVLVDTQDPLQRDGVERLGDDVRYDVLVKDKGVDPRGHFIERGGIYWPGDFHTWNMTTTYFNFEQAFIYFQALDAADPMGEQLKNMRVMYWPDVRIESPDPIVDNALYLSFIDSFVIAPFRELQKVPLAMNLGVIGHEVSHKVFSTKVYSRAGIAPQLTQWSGQPFNLLRSLDEGLADFHGYAVTCNEGQCRDNFLELSLEPGADIAQRQVTRQNACMTEGLRAALQTFTKTQWVQAPELYIYGNLWAAALFQGAQPGKETAVRTALLTAYDNGGGAKLDLKRLAAQNLNTPQNFTPEAVANTLVLNMPDDMLLKQTLCTQLVTRLNLDCVSFPCDKLPACPATAIRSDVCPVLPAP